MLRGELRAQNVRESVRLCSSSQRLPADLRRCCRGPNGTRRRANDGRGRQRIDARVGSELNADVKLRLDAKRRIRESATQEESMRAGFTNGNRFVETALGASATLKGRSGPPKHASRDSTKRRKHSAFRNAPSARTKTTQCAGQPALRGRSPEIIHGPD